MILALQVNRVCFDEDMTINVSDHYPAFVDFMIDGDVAWIYLCGFGIMKDKNWKRFVVEAEDGIFHNSGRPLKEGEKKKASEIWKEIIGDL